MIMKPGKNLKKKAMEILETSFHGLTYEEWCGKVKEQYKDVDMEIIKNTVTYLIENHWKVQYLKDRKRGKIYTHLDLLL